MRRISSSVSTKQQRIATLAREAPQRSFTSLAYLMDLEWLREAYRRTRKDGAVGVDGQTAADYARQLDANLQALLERAKAGTYTAPPVRRAYIPKAGAVAAVRPIGIPTLEDKILQRAVVMLLEPIYEHDFAESSYGCRPGRSAHQALDALWRHTMATQGGWILEVDIQHFFDTLDHAHLRAFLRHRVRDSVLLRLIGKWLNAGVLEDGRVTHPDTGTSQGGVASPLLANVYLHYVLDAWFEQEVKPCLHGQAFLLRYSDDVVIGFTDAADAQRVLEDLSTRVSQYGLALHPEKTRLVPFHRPAEQASGKGDGPGGRPGTFEWLGFTHYWGRSRKGTWVVKRQTAPSRLTRALHRIAHWCRGNRHQPLGEQQRTLAQKLRGHCAYYGITGNAYALARFRTGVLERWRNWLARRNRQREMDWDRFNRLLQRYPLPRATVVHSVYAP